MVFWIKLRRLRIILAAALILGAAGLGSTAAHAGVSVSIGVPGFWGYYGPPPVYYGPAYYGYPYGYAYYGYPGPVYWHRPWHYARHWHGHGRHWR
jgi:hypothetical protein